MKARQTLLGSGQNEFIKLRGYALMRSEENWVFAIHACPNTGAPSMGTVIVVPPYATNSHENFLLNYYLTSKGYNVVRFDSSNNAGLGSGTVRNFTMSGLQKDLELVLDSLPPEEFPVALVGQSLAFPPCLKLTCKDHRISLAVGLVGVVNVFDTVGSASKLGPSIFAPYLERQPNAPLLRKIFGHSVLGQEFTDDAVEHGFMQLKDTIRDIQKAKSKIVIVASKDDEYVRFGDVKKCSEHLPRGSLWEVEGIGHMIGRSLSTAKDISKLAVRAIMNLTDQPSVPRVTEVIRSASVETELLESCELEILKHTKSEVQV